MRCCDDLCRDGLTIVLCRMHHDVMSLWSDFYKCLPSFFGLGVLLWPCISLPVYPQGTSSPSALWTAVLPSPRNLSQASLAVPSLKYLWFSFNQTATASIWVGPFFSSWARHSAFDTGKTIFQTFSHLSSSVILGCLSSTRFRKPSGMLIWTRGLTGPFMMV